MIVHQERQLNIGMCPDPAALAIQTQTLPINFLSQALPNNGRTNHTVQHMLDQA